MKKAFTLIELLVVIAIIAILAAILFPVFAQAKLAAKKTVALSNVKQLGTSTNIYLADSDDVFPLAFSGRAPNANGQVTWRYATLHPVPGDSVSTGGWNTPAGLDASGQVWENSLEPYRKSYALLELAGMRKQGLNEVFIKKPALVGLVYNGLLHNLNSGEIASPSIAVMAWPGSGNANIEGRSVPNPVLNCAGEGSCKFTPGGPPQTGAPTGSLNYGGWDGTASHWVFGRTMPIVRTDSSAKSISSGTTITPATSQSPWAAPWASVQSDGRPNGLWTQCQPGNAAPVATAANARYWCFFRPDRTE